MVIMTTTIATVMIMKTMMVIIQQMIKLLYTYAWRVFRSWFYFVGEFTFDIFWMSSVFSNHFAKVLKFRVWITVHEIYYEKRFLKIFKSFFKTYFSLREGSAGQYWDKVLVWVRKKCQKYCWMYEMNVVSSFLKLFALWFLRLLLKILKIVQWNCKK